MGEIWSSLHRGARPHHGDGAAGGEHRAALSERSMRCAVETSTQSRRGSLKTAEVRRADQSHHEMRN